MLHWLYIGILVILKLDPVDSSDLYVTSLDLSNHTIPTNESVKTTEQTTQMKVADSSSRSEIYKMHNNGLVLLHAQRAHTGFEAKKSIFKQEAENSINYHVRSRTKLNDTSNKVAENEKHLEAKLGNLPQVHQKRSVRENYEQHLLKPVHSIPVIKQQKPCMFSGKKHKCPGMKEIPYKMSRKRKWLSLIQGENKSGKGRKKRLIYPEKAKNNILKLVPGLDSLPEEKDVKNLNIMNYTDVKRSRLRRAFVMMNEPEKDKSRFHEGENPLFDSDQPEESFKREYERYRALARKKNLGKLYNRGITGEIPDIPEISEITKSFDTIEPLEKFSDMRSALENFPRFGMTDLKLRNFPRFGEPKMDDYEQIPGIPMIRPLSRGDEVVGDRRGLPSKKDFYDEELDDSVEHIPPPREITSPTPIPSITDIPDITDIPTLKPIPPAPGRTQKSTGVNGKMPVVQTLNTAKGEETRVSA